MPGRKLVTTALGPLSRLSRFLQQQKNNQEVVNQERRDAMRTLGNVALGPLSPVSRKLTSLIDDPGSSPSVEIRYVDKPDEADLVYDKMRELYSGQSIFDEDLNDYVSEATPGWLEYESALNRLLYDDLVDDDAVLSLKSFLDEGREYTEGRLGHPSLEDLKGGDWGKKLYHGPLGKFFERDE